jgi:hypothetical protein
MPTVAERIVLQAEQLGITLTPSAEGVVIEPASKTPPDLIDAIRANKPAVLRLLRAPNRVSLLDLPFPVGFKGLPTEVAAAAEAWCDYLEFRDPIRRRIEVYSWVMDHWISRTMHDETHSLVDTDLYRRVKREKHRLLHAGGFADRECGKCDFEPWDAGTGQVSDGG